MNSFLWSDGDPSRTAFPLKGGAQSKPVSCMVVLFYTFRAWGENENIHILPSSNKPTSLLIPSLGNRSTIQKEKGKKN